MIYLVFMNLPGVDYHLVVLAENELEAKEKILSRFGEKAKILSIRNIVTDRYDIYILGEYVY